MLRTHASLLVLLLAACRTAPVAPTEPPLAFVVLERSSGGALNSGVISLPGTIDVRLRSSRWFVKPVEPNPLRRVARALRDTHLNGLSLAAWPRVDASELAALCAELSGSLEWLDLSRTALDVTALRALRGCTKLQALVLDGARVKDDAIAALPPLRVLDARDTALGDAAIATAVQWAALEELGFSKTRVTDAATQWLSRRPTLTRLELGDTGLGPEGVTRLTPLTALRVLDLGGTALTDASLSVLENLEQLESLSLANTVTSDAGLRHLRKLARLTSLNLSDTRITDAGLAGLETATHLEALLLATTDVSDVTGARLAGLKALRVVDLSETKVTTETARVLGTLTALEEVALRKTDVDDFGVTAMKGLVGLRTLDLESTQVSSSSLPVIGTFTALRSLDLGADLLHDAKLSELRALTQLEVLRLSRSFLPLEELTSLPNVAGLKTLDLSSLPVEDAHAQWLATHATRLELLKLNFTKVGDAGVTALSASSELRRLDLGRTALTDAGVRALVKAPQLLSLDLGLCTQLTSEGLRALGASRLESLFLAGTNADDAVVLALPATLRNVGLMKTKVTRASLPVLLKLPQLRELDVRELGLSDDELEPFGARDVLVHH